MSESEEVEAEARDGMQLRLAKYDEHFTIHRFFLRPFFFIFCCLVL